MFRSIFLLLFVLIFLTNKLFSQPITLRDTTNQYDYIIITVPEFVSACEPFKQHKESFRNFETLIVDTSQIFDEFDSSSTPQENIRDFISYAGSFWKQPKPEYFLLVGNLTKLPNFMDIFDLGGTIIDTAFTDFNYSVNYYSMDTTLSMFKLGRIPAANINQVSTYLDKVINFETDSVYGNWMNNNLFVSQFHPEVNYFQWIQNVTSALMENYPEYFTNYLYLDDQNSPNYGNRDSIKYFLNMNGASTLWLIGNNTNTQFGEYNILDTGDVKGFNNNPKNFITCFFAQQFYSRDDSIKGLADQMLLSQEASIVVLSPVGAVFVTQNEIFYLHIISNLFGTERKTVGESLKITRNSSGYTMSKRRLNIWGDPSLYPKYDILAALGNNPEVPNSFVLHQNFPNPFNPTTKIKYTLPTNELVSLKVYNTIGEEVASLVNEQQQAGSYEVEFNSIGLASGIYLYKITAGNFVETKKMIFLK